MPSMWSIDWRAIFVPSGSLLELVIRVSLTYLVIVAAFRVFRRDAGSLSVSDLLVVVLIADAAQNGMAGEYRSLTEGVVLVATIFAWSYALDWLAYHSRVAAWMLHPPPLPLIRNGQIQARNLRAELISRAELLAQLREQGVEHVGQVKQCCLESDGRMSVIKLEGDQPLAGESRRDRG
jgi:uncharacterized membrane protein YcaP (DUF421 family)